MTMRSGGQALVDALVAHGVDTVFGIPGTHNLAAFAALAASPIRTVLTRHEQGAGYAADGYARVAGRPGVCLTTTGPAILNALAAAAQAWSDSVPVLFISPGMSTGHPGRGNGLLHEVKDQHAAVEAVVAYSHRVGSVAEIPLAVTYAFSAMTTGRPRPVHIEIPLDLLDAEAEVHIVAPVAPRPVEPDTAALADAAARLAVAAEPVLIVGGGAKGAATQVRTVAEHLDAPVLMTANGKGVLDEAHPLAVGSGVHHPAARALLVSADAVLAIGTELAPSDFWYGPVDLGDKLIRVDVDAAAMVTNADPAVRLLGDASATLALLAGALPAIAAGTSRAAQARERLRADAAAEGGPWLDIMAALAPTIDVRTVVAADSNMASYYGALSNLPVHRPAGFLYPTGVGTLGYGLPAALGAALAETDSRVMALMGDGGIMFTMPELAAAAQQGVALPVVVVDNGGYGEIRNEMDDRGEPLTAVALGGVDFPGLARAMGCHGVTITEVSELTGAVETAFAADRPTLIHVREHSRASQ
ncbi:acetolactate synthase large subunit [Mycolicibacterium mageritense DSM 44476 = CIP 104973]|uniref:acetolactate synthase n=4 Tax=Mycolicibacterium mageritense TaxID=53462 RepID=A0AAI8TRQ4_MYCME|nr:thiamine pyrophosphate-binding protein [Mycolicibacterium mageritense]TXI63314.1 MAG: acetolactate synthase [Mycolicibacterium mageritense]BDY27750.1 putative 2-ketoarginine decarboxylase AruI [Mycolicibacterium mageritense]CDO22151.1 acetolactate synthase [Mycolicibacterium mageritense DSM 44476 = CIP 104973]